MSSDSVVSASTRVASARALFFTVSAALMLGACAGTDDGSSPTSLLGAPVGGASVASAEPNAKPDTRTELEKATEYWAKKYREKPTDKVAGVSYAKNLRALGEKRQALAVLQQMSMFHASDKEVASEYGRLALEFEQIGIARQMLALADDPGNPDWRVISARGTVLAKEGKFAEATPLYERALALAPDEPAVLNNLALAYAMGGEADKAEDLLRKIEVTGQAANPKIRQNLAIVLGLQGKFDESKAVAATSIGKEGAQANANLLRQFVKVEPVKFAKPVGGVAPGTAVAGWSATVADGAPAAPAKPAAGKPKKAVAKADDAYVAPVPGATPELGSPAADSQGLRGRTE